MESRLQEFLDYFGDNPYLRAAAVVVLSLILAKLADWLISKGLKVWARRTKTDLDDRIIQLLHRPLFLTVLVIGLYLALDELDLAAGTLLFFRRVLKTLVTLVWLVFAFRVCSIMLDVLSRLEQRFHAIQPRTITLFDQVFKIALAGGAVYFLFLIWGIDVGAWLAGAGIVGIAIGFAAKDTLANLISGIFIVADAPYKNGDFVVLDSGERGEVTHIGLRSTRLLTRDDVEITIPNAVMGNAKITNESGGRWAKQRLRVKVGVAYGSDIDRVSEILLAVAEEHSDIEDDPEPRVRFRSFGNSSLDFELLGWVREPVLRGRVLHELNSAIYRKFAADGVEIPYPKHDVYLYPQSPASVES